MTIRSFTIQIDGEDREVEVDDDRTILRFNSPGLALEAHLDFHRWLGSRYAHEMFRTLWARAQERAGPDDGLTLDDRANVQRALMMATVDSAETFYVSPHMVRLTNALVDEWGDTMPILSFSDVPAEAGVMVLGEPVFLGPPGTEDELMDFAVTRMLAWSIHAKGGASIVVGNYEINFSGDGDSPMQALVDRGGILIWDCFDGTRYLTAPGAWESQGRPPFIPAPTAAYAIDYDHAWDPDMTGSYQRRWLAVLFRLMWQRVLAPEAWHPPRPLARRAQREMSRMPLDGERVKVTHLRRYEPGWETEPSEVKGPRGRLTHTVVVKGHWRDHHFRSLGPARTDDGEWNEASHRRIWIDPHFRGEGPLIQKHSLTAVVR